MADDSNGECAVPVCRRFTSPSNGNGIFWYSFDYGPIHVVQMSTEHDWTPGSAQYDWLVNDLASVNRTVTPWVVLTGHRMMYTTQLDEVSDYIVSDVMKAALDGTL
jgi:acid phosphatase type 7